MFDIIDYYGWQRALCGGSLGPLKNLGWTFAPQKNGASEYVTDITGSALFGGVGGGGNSENELFVTYERVIRS